MRKAVVIETIGMARTMGDLVKMGDYVTVGDLRTVLEDLDDETMVFLTHNGGYTYVGLNVRVGVTTYKENDYDEFVAADI